MNKPHRKLINASLGSSSVRCWLGAVKLTDLKVCYERGADVELPGEQQATNYQARLLDHCLLIIKSYSRNLIKNYATKELSTALAFKMDIFLIKISLMLRHFLNYDSPDCAANEQALIFRSLLPVGLYLIDSDHYMGQKGIPMGYSNKNLHLAEHYPCHAVSFQGILY
ncbi:hypothetical protein PHDIMM138B_25590 [Phytobacter diazotrophicus]